MNRFDEFNALKKVIMMKMSRKYIANKFNIFFIWM